MLTIFKVTDHGTDGRDTRCIGFFTAIADAQKAARGRGAMGRGDGGVEPIGVFESLDEYRGSDEKARALAKLTNRERQLLGLEPKR